MQDLKSAILFIRRSHVVKATFFMVKYRLLKHKQAITNYVVKLFFKLRKNIFIFSIFIRNLIIDDFYFEYDLMSNKNSMKNLKTLK